MLNITPDLEQFSLGEPGGPVSMKAATKKPAAKKAPATKLKPVAVPAKKSTCKKSASKAAAPAQSGYPALDAGPSGPMLNFGFQDGPSGPMFQDGPSGPTL